MAGIVIVIESPNKIAKFKKYLPHAQIYATAGHFRDLPDREMGVDLDTFEPRFVKDRNKAASIRKIVEAAREAVVYVATDADREGYAIGKFVYDEVRRHAERVMRAEIREITKKGIEEGLAAAVPFEETNLALFESWKGRRVGDRIVGYILSPEATKALGGKGDVYSVGRVQSSAVRLLVEREREIRDFVVRPFWKLRLRGSAKGEEVVADVVRDEVRCFDREEAELTLQEVERWLARETPVVAAVERAEAKRNPPAPFTTSTLQQAASSQLGFDSEKTMNLAQKLFEGGWITYHRVDSTELSAEFQNLVREFIAKSRYAKYYDKPKSHKPKGKKAAEIQGAHEAIRPTTVGGQKGVAREVVAKLGDDGLKLYELIYRRAVASQMKPALYDTLAAEIAIGECSVRFVAKGRALRFPGYLAFYNQDRDEGEEVETAALPPLEEGQTLRVVKVEPQQSFTQPPPRYSEATLVKALEEKGIGRPSTYASIISTIQERDYVRKERGKFVPTEVGRLVNTVLVKSFPGNCFIKCFTVIWILLNVRPTKIIPVTIIRIFSTIIT